MYLKVVRAFEKIVAAGAARKRVAIRLRVIKLQIEAPEPGLKFRNHAPRFSAERNVYRIKVVERWTVCQARISSLGKPKIRLAIDAEVRRKHHARAELPERASELWRGIRISCSERIHQRIAGRSDRRAGACKYIKSALRLRKARTHAECEC